MRASFDTDLLISFSLGQVFLFFVCHTSEFLKRETTITILKTKSINSSGTLEPFLLNISPDRKWWKFFWQPCLPNLRCSIKALNHFLKFNFDLWEIICFWTFEKKNCLHPLELVPSDKAIAVSINPSESSLFIKIGWVKISASSTIIITITKVLHYSHSHPYHLHPVQFSRRALSAGSSSTAQRPSTDPLLPNLTWLTLKILHFVAIYVFFTFVHLAHLRSSLELLALCGLY